MSFWHLVSVDLTTTGCYLQQCVGQPVERVGTQLDKSSIGLSTERSKIDICPFAFKIALIRCCSQHSSEGISTETGTVYRGRKFFSSTQCSITWSSSVCVHLTKAIYFGICDTTFWKAAFPKRQKSYQLVQMLFKMELLIIQQWSSCSLSFWAIVLVCLSVCYR